MWKETIALRSVYDFDYVLKRLAMDPLHHVDLDEQSVLIPVELNHENHVVKVTSMGTISNPKFEVASTNEKNKRQLIKKMEDLFQWEKDLAEIGAHFVGTNLEQLFSIYPATPVVRDFQLYPSLMKTIIHQQLNMKFAHTLTTRFVQTFGSEYQGIWFYPKPDEVAELSYHQLRELQFSQRKAEYVIDTSRMIANGELQLEELAQQSNQKVMERLVKLRGIGNWTAANWLLVGLGREDLFPATDIGIQNALKLYFNRDKKPSLTEIEAWSRDWSPYRSYATLTLWRSIEG